MADKMFKLNIGPNLILLQVSILNGTAMVALFVTKLVILASH